MTTALDKVNVGGGEAGTAITSPATFAAAFAALASSKCNFTRSDGVDALAGGGLAFEGAGFGTGTGGGAVLALHAVGTSLTEPEQSPLSSKRRLEASILAFAFASKSWTAPLGSAACGCTIFAVGDFLGMNPPKWEHTLTKSDKIHADMNIILRKLVFCQVVFTFRWKNHEKSIGMFCSSSHGSYFSNLTVPK